MCSVKRTGIQLQLVPTCLALIIEMFYVYENCLKASVIILSGCQKQSQQPNGKQLDLRPTQF